MRAFLLLLFASFLAWLFLAAPLALAADERVGALVSDGGSVSSTGLRKGRVYAIQCDGAVHVNTGSGTATATSTGVKVPTDGLYDIPLEGTVDTIAIIPVTGGATCQIYQVTRR